MSKNSDEFEYHLYSIGHGNRSFEELLGALRAFDIESLVDVRLLPGSRRYPQFSRDCLAATLLEHRIQYRWMRDLGGRRKARPDSIHTGWSAAGFRGYADYMETTHFQVALEVLVQAAAGRATAIMCAERLWWQCHRRLIADALTVRGLPVVHILDARKSEAHTLTPFLRIEEGRLVYRGLF